MSKSKSRKSGFAAGRTGRAIVIGSAVVLFWRGAWGLLDLYFFPGHLPTSYIASLVLGLVILKIYHMIKILD